MKLKWLVVRLMQNKEHCCTHPLYWIINTFMGSRKFSDLLFSPLSPFSLSPFPGFLSVFSATDIAPVNKASPAKESRRQFGPSQDAQTKICCAGKYLPRDPSMSIASVQLSWRWVCRWLHTPCCFWRVFILPQVALLTLLIVAVSRKWGCSDVGAWRSISNWNTSHRTFVAEHGVGSVVSERHDAVLLWSGSGRQPFADVRCNGCYFNFSTSSQSPVALTIA